METGPFGKTEKQRPGKGSSYDTGKRCVAWGCSNTSAMEGISTFLFPKDEGKTFATDATIKKSKKTRMQCSLESPIKIYSMSEPTHCAIRLEL